MPRILLVSMLILVTGCAELPKGDGAYLVPMPNDLYAALSGDGDTLLIDGGIWTKSRGYLALNGVPEGYGYSPKAVSYHGTAIAGQFSKYVPYVGLVDYGIFRWTAATGIQLLEPHLFFRVQGGSSYAGVEPPMRIDDDGTKISFFCDDVKLRGKFDCDSGPLPDPSDSAEKIWTPTGIEDTSRLFGNKYDYVRVADDFEHYVVATSSPPSLGIVDKSGIYTGLRDFDGQLDRWVDRSYYNGIVMNSRASIVAEWRIGAPLFNMIWNGNGDPRPPLKLPAACLGYRIVAVDDAGAVFVNAYCPSMEDGFADSIGFRVTSHGAETIHSWLQANGLSNSLPLGIAIQLVSDNGKTVYGIIPGPPGISAIGPIADIRPASFWVPSGLQPNEAFLAHVP